MVSFGILFFLAISMTDANLEFVSGFVSFCSEKNHLNKIIKFNSLRENITIQFKYFD